MSLYVCPAAVVTAPCATVWEVLKTFPSDPSWMGVGLQRAEPSGRLQPGQVLLVSTTAFGRHWQSRIEIEAMDEEKGFIDMRVLLPLRIVNREHMTLAPVLAGKCQVQFG